MAYIDRFSRYDLHRLLAGLWQGLMGSPNPREPVGISARTVRAARALLGWSQEELARKAVVGLGTVKRLEKGLLPLEDGGGRKRRLSVHIERAIEAAFTDAGIILDPTPSDLAGDAIEVCLALRKRDETDPLNAE